MKNMLLEKLRVNKEISGGERKTGIDIIGSVPWGMHLCLFYRTKEDLINILAPYFRTGLENNEFCMWVTSYPLNVEEAKSRLKEEVYNLDDYIEKGQIEILDYSRWYKAEGRFDAKRVLQGWVEKYNQAMKKGCEGMRVSGDTFWLEDADWKNFDDYEKTVDKVIGNYKMLAICSYALDKCSAYEIINVVCNHQFAIIRRQEKWQIIESANRKQVAEALLISEQKFKNLTENTIDWIWEVDKNGIYTYVSPKVKDLLGYEVNEVLGKTPFDIMPEKEAKKISEIFKQKVCKKESICQLENINRRKDGYLVVLETSAAPVLDETGELIGYRGIDRDITERKKTGDRMRIFLRALEGASDGIMITGINGNIMFANKALMNMFGYSAGEILESNLNKLNIIPEKTKKIWRPARTKNGWSGEALCVKKTKQVFPVDLSISVVKDAEERPIALMGVFRDITKYKKIEGALKKASESDFKKQKLALEQKNLALKELIEHIVRTRDRMKEDIDINVREILLPVLERVKIKGQVSKYVHILYRHLKELTSSFGRRIIQKSNKLTPKEIEICSMLRGGLATKELSELLNISIHTIEKHRKNIRKKLGISNREINLSSYLKNL